MGTILVTGGCGFIGANLVPALLKRSTQVRVLDNLSTGVREDIESLGVELQVGDIRDEAAAARAMEGVKEVIHLAAHTRVVDSIQNPLFDFESNARGTLNLLLAAQKAGVRKFVMASTGGAILGEKEPPVNEGMVAQPLSPYGASKLAGEGYCSAFYGSYGMGTVALRFSNVYGPFSYHKASVVAAFFKRMLQGEALIVYGDGQQTRDFLFVEDVVEGIIAALDRSPGGEVYHLASGRETSVNELVEAIREAIREANFKVEYQPARQGEVRRNYASIRKAATILGFDPKTSLQEGLRKTWRWFQARRKAVLAVAPGPSRSQ